MVEQMTPDFRPEWVQPICARDWRRFTRGHPPGKVQKNPRAVPCAFCGRATRSGLFVNVPPVTVPYRWDGTGGRR